VLLLIDLASKPIEKKNLKPTYDPIHAGAGKFHRHAVRVVYAHRELAYDFIWKPFKPAT
jgi:hypothetical protein